MQFSRPDLGKHQELLDIRNAALIANHLRKIRVAENVKNGANLAVDHDLIADEADAVAVIGISRAMNGAERLNEGGSPCPWSISSSA